jgi:hypothetical protein
MFDMRPVEMVDEEGFAVATPYKTEAFLSSVAWGAFSEGVDDAEGACEAEGVIEERALEGIAVMYGVIDVGWGVKKLFVFVGWCHTPVLENRTEASIRVPRMFKSHIRPTIWWTNTISH